MDTSRTERSHNTDFSSYAYNNRGFGPYYFSKKTIDKIVKVVYHIDNQSNKTAEHRIGGKTMTYQEWQEARAKKEYVIEKINIVYSGAGWRSGSNMAEEWAITTKLYGIRVKTFKTRQEAVEYFNENFIKSEAAIK